MEFYFLRFIDAIDFNVGISIGQTSTQDNALEQQYDGYNIIYVFRPFSEEYFERLVFRLEAQLSHPIRFYYLTDHKSIHFLKGRRGWKMVKRDFIFRKYGLCVWKCPQYYSIWDYIPSLAMNADA